MPRTAHRTYLAFVLLVATQVVISGAFPAEEPFLLELPKEEGANLIAPYELWIATFGPDEGSYGSGPRILLITNDRETAVANVRGHRTELAHLGEVRSQCQPGGKMTDTYQAQDIVLYTRFTTDPGEEACWVEGTISITIGKETQTFRVKGASGL